MSINNNIANIARKLGGHCKLVAVSKTKPPELIREAYEAGQRDFGENKVQELTDKHHLLPKDIRWHMIGHLQTNKVKYIVPFVYLIHAVDSDKLLREIQKQGKKFDKKINCLLQVHIAREETKFGWEVDELMVYIQSPLIQSYDFIQVKGLMGMATFTDDKEQVKKEFRILKNLFEEIKRMSTPENIEMKELSMGMSNDYE
ncbi:MAG: YggS family pyridoxal phosphate-dependent enzyme, partial [Cyclobacteriaceae bacterium]|nr:YggS family pyridoxal phosphate-dependent enzyme [Cyclobacteriaceae bacterium]